MESEELIRKIMAEVMAKVGTDQAGPSATAATAAPAASGATVTAANYPLSEKSPEKIKSASGRPFSEFSFDKVMSGDLTADDFRIAPETLRMQADVADSVGRESFGRNMRRAAELIKVPDDELLQIYDSLRPYRSTKAELYAIADRLETTYGCTVNAAFIREAADVYEKRGRLKS